MIDAIRIQTRVIKELDNEMIAINDDKFG